MRVAGIVLAAGRSTRMGRNKLLLSVGGESLVRRAVRTAIEGELDPVLVVVGHDAEKLRSELADLGCIVVLNPRYELGMNASIDAGIAAVPGDASAAVVLLADMPLVTAAMTRAILARHRAGGASLVASRYGDVAAPPTLFGRAFFDQLRGEEGDGRGREVLRRHAEEVAWIDWPVSALADVDETGDLERAMARLDEERRWGV